MSQATLDLPDPTADPTVETGLSPQSADELLSQMAGEEVDRLLRQNDLSDAGLKPTEVPELTNAPAQRQSPDSPLVTVPAPPTARAEVAVEPPGAPEEIDSLLAQLTDGPDTVEPVVAFEDVAADSGTRDEERAALRDDPPVVGPAIAAIESAVRKVDAEPRPPLLPRILAALEAPLRLINTPIAGLSPATRTAIGKIAIVTLFNATAVLLYVVTFR